MTNKRVQAAGLGKSIRTARHAARLTQGQLGEKVCLHRNAVVAVEDGRGHLDTLTALADALGLEITGRTLPGNGALASRMLDLRKRRRLSRRTAAALAGTSVPAIESIERSGKVHVAGIEALGRAIGAGLCLIPKGTAVGFWTGPAASSVEQDWYTPGWLLERVVGVVGPFDTDPCSPGRGRTAVRAKLHFTAADDGLNQAWPGLCWLNPPYGRDIGRWLAKARHEVDAGHARCVVGLVPARTDTVWWHSEVASWADAVLLKGRLTFEGADGAAPFPSAIIAYGLSVEQRDQLFRVFPDAWHVPSARVADTSDAPPKRPIEASRAP
nr:DNA N-6-adenine-methyltransferase [uncultured Rhodopila sp.]